MGPRGLQGPHSQALFPSQKALDAELKSSSSLRPGGDYGHRLFCNLSRTCSIAFPLCSSLHSPPQERTLPPSFPHMRSQRCVLRITDILYQVDRPLFFHVLEIVFLPAAEKEKLVLRPLLSSLPQRVSLEVLFSRKLACPISHAPYSPWPSQGSPAPTA